MPACSFTAGLKHWPEACRALAQLRYYICRGDLQKKKQPGERGGKKSVPKGTAYISIDFNTLLSVMALVDPAVKSYVNVARTSMNPSRYSIYQRISMYYV